MLRPFCLAVSFLALVTSGFGQQGQPLPPLLGTPVPGATAAPAGGMSGGQGAPAPGAQTTPASGAQTAPAAGRTQPPAASPGLSGTRTIPAPGTQGMPAAGAPGVPAPQTGAPAPGMTIRPVPPSTTTTTTTTTTEAAAPAAVPTLTAPPTTEIRPLTPGPGASPAVGAGDRMITLQYPNSDVVDVLRLYETLTGKKLVMDNFVQGKVNIFLSKPVPREEAIRIIEINLLMNDYALVPAQGDVVKVIGTGRNPRNAGVPIISDEADIPIGDRVVSFLFKLRYADPLELQQVLSQYLQPPKTYTSFLALPKSGSILVTENSSVIRGLVHIIEQVDIPPAEVVSEFITLTRADATKVVDMLKEVFEKGAQPQGGVPGQPVQPGVRPVRQAVPNAPPVQQVQEGDIGALAALSEDSVVIGKIKISADVRTNRIHVITRPINMPFVRKLISEFDANVEFAKPVTRALRYISAAEVLPVIVQALTEPGGNQQGGGEGAPANPNAPQQQAQQNQRRTTSSSAGTYDSGTAGGGGQSFSEELSTQAVDTTPRAVTIGNAKIIADQRANTIIVLGNREVVVKVAKILDEMDVKAPQVALSTVIGELTLNKNEEFGVDWFQRYRATGSEQHTTVNGETFKTPNDTGLAGISRNTNVPIIDPRTLTDISALQGVVSGGTSIFLSTGFGLSALVRALDASGKFKVISRPMVFTSNNKKAIIASGQEIPVPVSSLSSFVPTTQPGTTPVQNFGTQSSIQYKKVALQLEVVPLINSEKEVTLDILQKLDNIAGSTKIDGNDIPNVATRYIKTTVSAPNGSTIVLGGLITDNNRRGVSGIPLLSKIPVIGGLFRNTSKMKDRQELIILMRPEVALTKLDLYRLRRKNSEKTHFGPELNQDDCPDCPTPLPTEDKEIVLPAPDLPGLE